MKTIYNKDGLIVSDNEVGGVVFSGGATLIERDTTELVEALRKWAARSSVAGHFARRPGMTPTTEA
jgi:hypothetical protein